MANKIYIPTFISSVNYEPVKTLPHIYFYNGTKECELYYIEGWEYFPAYNFSEIFPVGYTKFPYFDNYSGNTTTTDSLSLLFNNELAVYGESPTKSLYSEYWSTYVNLLYGPRTKIFDCSAIIPLADYFQMNLNDIVEWRGNYYHLRAINDYNLSNGECKLQLLGPVIDDTISNVLPGLPCEFNFSIENYIPIQSSSFTIAQCFGTGSKNITFSSSVNLSIGNAFTLSSSYALPDCWYVSSSYSGALDLTDVSISQSFVNCTACSASLHPTSSTSVWTIGNEGCGLGTINDVGINSSFMNTLEGPSTFPLTSGLYGVKTNPSGINYGSTNTIQCNVTTNIAGPGNCAAIFVYKNGATTPDYSYYFASDPYPQISGVVINSGDTITVNVECFPLPCP